MGNDYYQMAYNFMKNAKENLSTTVYKFDSLIEQYATEASSQQELFEGEIIYRARIYEEEDAKVRFSNPPINTKFKGYDAKNSFVNLSKTTKEGRCNPKGTPYLYAASSENTCIYEVRPCKNEYISIAEIEVEQPIRLLNARMYNAPMADTNRCTIDGIPDYISFFYITREFCLPCRSRNSYKLCQYLSEKFKSYGFDGISYNSSINNCSSSINYVIFNYNKCKPISSVLRKINNIEIDYI